MPLDPNDPDVQALQKSVADMTVERDTAVTSVETITVERDKVASELEAGTKQMGVLQEANKKFVDQVVEMKPKVDGLPVLQEEATKLREQVGTLTTELATSTETIKGLNEKSIQARRDNLVKNYKIPAEKIATMTEAQLEAIEATVPGFSANPTGKGLDIDGTGQGKDLTQMTEIERAKLTIERLKKPVTA